MITVKQFEAFAYRMRDFFGFRRFKKGEHPSDFVKEWPEIPERVSVCAACGKDLGKIPVFPGETILCTDCSKGGYPPMPRPICPMPEPPTWSGNSFFLISPKCCGRALETMREVAEERGRFACRAIDLGEVEVAFAFAKAAAMAGNAAMELEKAPVIVQQGGEQ